MLIFTVYTALKCALKLKYVKMENCVEKFLNCFYFIFYENSGRKNIKHRRMYKNKMKCIDVKSKFLLIFFFNHFQRFQ